MSRVEFTKMVATGNDFILVDNRDRKAEKKIGDFSRFAKEVCARRCSIGANGLLLIQDSKNADVTMRIFNPDGGEVTMCGNGARCVAYYAASNGITKDRLSVETKAGILKANVSNDTTKIEMMQPKGLRVKFPLKACGMTFEVSFVNAGVPHVVGFAEDLDVIDVRSLGREIRFHKQFAPEGANANFVKVNDSHSISIRTYERGVEDETLACGTGAVAGTIVASELRSVKSPVKVGTSGGEYLTVHFKRKGNGYKEVFLEGEVKLVYNGGIKYV